MDNDFSADPVAYSPVPARVSSINHSFLTKTDLNAALVLRDRLQNTYICSTTPPYGFCLSLLIDRPNTDTRLYVAQPLNERLKRTRSEPFLYVTNMAEDTQNTRATRAKNEAIHTEAKEDAETRATRRELKQSSISDPSASTDKEQAEEKGRPETPDNDDLKDQVASPKKKRAHDQLDSSKDNDDKESVASADSSKDRADRSEPEKKRARDEDGKEQVRCADMIHLSKYAAL